MSDVQVAPSYERTIINAGSFDYLLITSQTDNLCFDILFFLNLIGHNRHAMRLKKENATAVITALHCKTPDPARYVVDQEIEACY